MFFFIETGFHRVRQTRDAIEPYFSLSAFDLARLDDEPDPGTEQMRNEVDVIPDDNDEAQLGPDAEDLAVRPVDTDEPPRPE